MILDALARVVGVRRLYLGRFLLHHRRWPQLSAPVSIMDKIAARILAGCCAPRRRKLTDKLLCREIVTATCPELRQKRLLKVFARAEELHLAELPEAFVLKPNHASGMNLLVFDKNKVNEQELRKIVTQWLKFNYYRISQEPSYRDIEPQVFAEELLSTDEGLPPAELQLFCFYGRVEFLEYQGLTLKGKENPFYDRDWNLLPVRYPEREDGYTVSRPIALAEAIAAAEKIAKGADFLRVDIFTMPDGTLVFGETASSPWAGLFRLEPEGAEKLLGEYWTRYSSEEQGSFAI